MGSRGRGAGRQEGKGLKQARGETGLERSRSWWRWGPGGGQVEARKTMTESGLLSTGCPATPDQALHRTLAASPLPSTKKKAQEVLCPDKKAVWVTCFQREEEGLGGGGGSICRSDQPLDSELPEMIFLGHWIP